MRFLFAAILALLCTYGNAQARVLPVPFPEIARLQDITPTALGTVGGRSSATASAITSCDITTGACTGADAGTGLFTAATCDGVADDQAAFNSFNTFAKATATNTNGQLIELFIPSGKPVPMDDRERKRQPRDDGHQEWPHLNVWRDASKPDRSRLSSRSGLSAWGHMPERIE
jgi:hypothetical protein